MLVRDIFGQPVQGMDVEVHPFGDRLSPRASSEPLRLTTDASGALTFEFPRWTHVVLRAATTEIAGGRPIPDYVRRARVLATSRTRVVLRLVAPGGVQRMPTRVRAGDAVFRRVHEVRGNEALYVTEVRPLPPGETVTVTLDYQPRGAVLRPREIDFSGGETETIDLRE